MSLDQIRLFISVYNARSFTSVAKELNIASSSVSRAIARLEDQLQTRLFQRTTRTLTPTQLGEYYFHRVEALIEELELVEQEIVTQSSKPFGSIRVTASTSFGQAVLAPMIKGFHEQYPEIHLELLLSDVQANVIEEQVDIAIRHGSLRDSNLIARKLLDVRYLLVASKGYLEKVKKIESPDDILEHRLISFGYRKFSKEWNFRKDGLTETIPIMPILTVTTASAIKECVKSGIGIALLPDWIVNDELQELKLVNLLPDWQIAGADFDTSIWLVYPSRTFVPAKTRAFIEYSLNNIL